MSIPTKMILSIRSLSTSRAARTVSIRTKQGVYSSESFDLDEESAFEFDEVDGDDQLYGLDDELDDDFDEFDDLDDLDDAEAPEEPDDFDDVIEDLDALPDDDE